MRREAGLELPVVRRLVDAPTVRVEVVEGEEGLELRKLYSFPRWGQRWRAALRHTWLGQAKGEREAANLLRLAQGGAPALAPIGCGSRRDRLGFVRASWLWLPYLEGWVSLAEVLRGQAEPPPAWRNRGRLWQEVGAGVARIHALGCRYRDLRPRNLLLGPAGMRWIDASKSRWLPEPLPRAQAAEELAGFLLPWEGELGEDFTAFWRGYRGWEGVERAVELTAELATPARKRLRRLLEREAARCQALS